MNDTAGNDPRRGRRGLRRTLAGVTASLVTTVVALVPGVAHAAPEPLEGVNDFSCRPSTAHPRPVVLVHGTWSDAASTWATLAPRLIADGYCVFAPTYGTQVPDGNLLGLVGAAPISTSAVDLGRFIDRVLTETGAAKVDVVAHSQGALVSRKHLQITPPAKRRIGTLVSVAGSNHGTSFGGKQQIGALAMLLNVPVIELYRYLVGPSFVEQMAGSPTLRALNKDGDTVPGVRYVALASKTDGVITPPESALLTAGPGATVENIWIQDREPGATTDHGKMTSDPVAVDLMEGALGG